MYRKLVSTVMVTIILMGICFGQEEPCQKSKMEIAADNNEFALKLFNEISSDNKDKNVFYSPYSIFSALSMLYEGAAGTTAKEMEEVLAVPKDDSLRQQGFQNTLQGLNKKEKSYKLRVANALWAQNDYTFLDKYLKIIEKVYRGKVTNLDFKQEVDKSCKIINDWVASKTNNKINEIVSPGVINSLTRLVLTNAIYFKGEWKLQFDEQKTREESFSVKPSQKIKVPMMRLTGRDVNFRYAEYKDLKVLEMPYTGKDLSMVVLLPKGEPLDTLEKKITLKNLNKWRENLHKQRVKVYFPRFKLKTKYSLGKMLSSLGMKTAFTEKANFSKLDGTKNLLINSVLHKAFVEVNEEGTEAAAATSVSVGITSATTQKVATFRADHPFLFFIQHKEMGNILFMGKVVNPG